MNLMDSQLLSTCDTNNNGVYVPKPAADIREPKPAVDIREPKPAVDISEPKPAADIRECETELLDLKAETDTTEPGTEVQQTTENLSAPFLFPQKTERQNMADNGASTCAAPQRKLPIPNVAANSNSSLKGILIKPKRILPAQPDSLKVKRAIHETGTQYKTTERADDNPLAGLNQPNEGVSEDSESSQKLSITKLDIDVDRLKSYFQTHKDDVGRRNTDFNGKHIQSGINEGQKSTPVRSQSECGNAPHACFTRESTLYNFSPDGLSKVREWCSPSEMNKMTTKMATDCSVTKSLERGIRSPSPKSSTTWDRSSSGYSSDERPDPKSPPLIHNANMNLKAETDIADDDGVSMLTDKVMRSVKSESTDTITNNEGNVYCQNDDDMCNTKDYSQDNEKCQNLNASNPSAETGEIPGQSISLQIDSALGFKQNTRRPAWTALSNMPSASGRIQYRKSGSESMISLRHPIRQGIVDTNFDGLEVCGKSYPQTITSTTAKSDSDGTKPDIISRTEAPTPSSAFTPIERPVPILELGTEVPKTDINSQESAVRARILRQQFAVCRSPRDMKSLTNSMNAKLNLPRDDKDIRKSLHDLNSPRRQSPAGKVAPIRARHMIHMTSNNSNQPMTVFDTSTSQPTSVALTTVPKPINNDNGKPGIKFFGKKMWRAPSGQPENAQTRPFSPFGGTLPPSKIQEQELKRHSPDPPPPV